MRRHAVLVIVVGDRTVELLDLKFAAARMQANMEGRYLPPIRPPTVLTISCRDLEAGEYVANACEPPIKVLIAPAPNTRTPYFST